MTFLKVLLIIAAVLWLIGRIRLGAMVQYDEDGVLVKAIAGPLKIVVFPQKELSPEEKAKRKAKERDKQKRAEEKKAKKEAKRKKHQEEHQEKKGGALPPFTKLLPLVAEAAGGLKKRIRIDELTLHIAWAAQDPMETALGFGRANAALGMIWPLLDHNFNVKKHDLGVSVDFNGSSPSVMCRAALTARLGQLVSFGLRLICKFLGIMIRSRAEGRRKNSSTKKQEA